MSLPTVLSHAMAAVLRLSSRWWLVAGLVAVDLASFQLLFWLESRFEALSGRTTLDTQNALTRADVAEQLPLYTGPAGRAYLAFAAFDFVFPLVAGLTVAVVCTTLLRHNPSAAARTALRLRLPLFALLGTAFDHLENIAFLMLVAGDLGQPNGAVVTLALAFKALKLLMLAASGLAVATLAVWLVAARLSRRARQRAGRAAGTGTAATAAPRRTSRP